ncbi:MAG: Brp/Blh family beta-carotene 15,15'-dioxygenase [Jejuia sp.]
MYSIRNLSIVLSFVGLWLTSLVSKDLEIILGFLLIFSFGICHGSNDILLINRLADSNTYSFSLKVLVIYICIVLTALLVFYFLPSIALILFIIFSGFHFGEQHWEGISLTANKIFNNAYYIIYGTLVLFTLLIYNSEETKEVVYAITSHEVSNSLLYSVFWILLTCYLLSCFWIILSNNSMKSVFLTETFYLVIFAVIFKVTTLIWGFAIYFIFWHSIPSLFEQVKFLYGKFNYQNFLKYLKNAILYWIIALIGLAILYYFFKNQTIFYGILFSFIAAVTFPHTIVMNSMFKNKKSTTL